MRGAPLEASASPSSSPIVLLVEDEEVLVDMFTAALEGKGYEVLAVGRGDEAADAARRAGPSLGLAIVDWTMPGMLGPEVVVALREIRPDLPVLMTSGLDPDDLPHPRPTNPSTEFLKKPFSIDRLLEVVRSLLTPPRG